MVAQFRSHTATGRNRDSQQDTTKSIRVLTVDDSALMRLTLSRYLNQEPGIEVVGQGQNGSEVLPLVKELEPDVVVLDVEMPKMNGLEALQELMTSHPTPVIMLSNLTSDGAAVTIQALEIGAFDFVVKPQPGTTMSETVEILVEKIRYAVRSKRRPIRALRQNTSTRPASSDSPAKSSAQPTSSSSSPLAAPKSRHILRSSRVKSQPDLLPSTKIGPMRSSDTLIMVASSTGGPSALTDFLSSIAPNLSLGGVIVQHMPASFTTILSERLDKSCHYKIQEAQAGDRIQRGQFLVAPGGHHLLFDDQSTAFLSDAPTVNGVRPAADVTMKSLSRLYGSRILAVVLTGMGKDGFAGTKDILQHGGRVIAQDEESSVVFGMPRHIVEENLAVAVGTPEELANFISETVSPD